jgi:hypothetical protein
MGLVFSQTDERIASGAIAFGSLTGTTSATTVSEEGQIRLTATISPTAGNSIRVNAENIVLNSPSAGNIQGNLEQVWSSTIASGTMRVSTRVANLTRTSGGPSLLAAPPTNATTLEDLIRLMRVK